MPGAPAPPVAPASPPAPVVLDVSLLVAPPAPLVFVVVVTVPPFVPLVAAFTAPPVVVGVPVVLAAPPVVLAPGPVTPMDAPVVLLPPEELESSSSPPHAAVKEAPKRTRVGATKNEPMVRLLRRVEGVELCMTRVSSLVKNPWAICTRRCAHHTVFHRGQSPRPPLARQVRITFLQELSSAEGKAGFCSHSKSQ